MGRKRRHGDGEDTEPGELMRGTYWKVFSRELFLVVKVVAGH